MKAKKFFSHWSQVRSALLATIDKFSDDELAYAPAGSSWTAGKIMLHIGDAEDGWLRYVIQRDLPGWPVNELDEFPTKRMIKAYLAEVHSRTDSYLATLELADLEREVETPWSADPLELGWIIWHVLEHEIHHRGELSLMLGLLGREGLDV